MTDETREKISDATKEAERAQAGMRAQPDRMPTPEEEAAAERAPKDPDAAEHAKEMAERGANQKGEGRVP